FTLSATILLVNDIFWLAAIAALAALGMGIALFRLLKRIDRYDRLP
ncbi:MAG: hypothetical protein F6K03_07225, partial [Kamptonema sp. SIO4C4]|nr:hypothetical protein [Kamptonema sp. SIO4C4]